MNTTSMEFILCQDKTSKSPLVLSEFMGTAPSFASALQINPHDLLGVAQAINKGLTMREEEKAERHANLLEGVLAHTSHTWAATILKQLLENVGGEHTAHHTPALDTAQFADAYKKANKRLLLFDYDGTLTPIVKVPAHAVPTERTRNAIAALCKDPKNIVYLISGRDGDFLEEHWGHLDRLGLSAEHGSFVKQPGEEDFINMTEALDMSWMSEVEEIFKYYTEVSFFFFFLFWLPSCSVIAVLTGRRGRQAARSRSKKLQLLGTTEILIPTLENSSASKLWIF